MKAPKPSRSNQKASTRVGWSDLLGRRCMGIKALNNPAGERRRFALRAVNDCGVQLSEMLNYPGPVAVLRDALEREESCGGHFREEFQTTENEAKRDDEKFCHVAAWEWLGENKKQIRHKEELSFENIHLATRSYK